jgi:mannose-6-phosphate isomerase-like protein (cupin superfamily)
MITSINIQEKFDRITSHWTPGIVAELNGQYVKLAKIKGELIWHNHADEDELFVVMKGTLIMEFRTHTTHTREGEMLLVPRGMEHLPRTNGEEVWVMLFEPKQTRHTGDVEHEKTVKDLQWI